MKWIWIKKLILKVKSTLEHMFPRKILCQSMPVMSIYEFGELSWELETLPLWTIRSHCSLGRGEGLTSAHTEQGRQYHIPQWVPLKTEQLYPQFVMVSLWVYFFPVLDSAPFSSLNFSFSGAFPFPICILNFSSVLSPFSLYWKFFKNFFT